MPKVAPSAIRLYGPLTPGFGGRVEQLVSEIGEKTEAARTMGISVDQVDKIISERSVPNFAAIAALIDRVGARFAWLAFARGDRHRHEPSTRKSFSEAADEMVRIRSLDGPETFQLPRRLFVLGPANHDATAEDMLGHHAAFLAPSSAMDPTIRRDALVIVDTADKKTSDGQIFLFDFGGDRLMRRTQREPDGSLTLRADNHAFEPMRLSPEEAASEKVMGRVVWIGGRV